MYFIVKRQLHLSIITFFFSFATTLSHGLVSSRGGAGSIEEALDPAPPRGDTKDKNTELENLLKNLSDCQLEMQNLNKSILKQMPHESYLMYRRIINLNQFCSKLEKDLNDDESDDFEDKLFLISNAVQNLLKEDPRELPHMVSQFPDRSLYYNNASSSLWPQITTVLIQNSVNEIRNLFRLDLNRKSLLGIQLKIKHMQPKAVVRADIIQISSPVHFFIQTEKDKSKPYYLDGMFFANHMNHDLNGICKNNSGNAGIDLTAIQQSFVNSIGIRGVWDEQTKLSTARIFGIQAALEKNCRNIYFKASKNFLEFLQYELDTLKTESLSMENSLLLSNYGQKKLWVMPGRYRIVISSIITEKIISIQEFLVGENTQTNVIANVL